MRPAELDALTAILATLSPTAHIVEFGSGGSTVWLANHLQFGQHLFSIEHDPVWYQKVRTELDQYPQHLRQLFVHLVLREDTLKMEILKVTLDGPTNGLLMTAYVDVSRYTPEESSAGRNGYLNLEYGNDWNRTELVVVDGVARGCCLALLRTVLPPGCLVLLHDYEACESEASRVEWYQFGVRLYQSVETVGSLAVLKA